VLADGGGDALDSDRVQMLRIPVGTEFYKLLHIDIVLKRE
jgi:hypothetical protein